MSERQRNYRGKAVPMREPRVPPDSWYWSIVGGHYVPKCDCCGREFCELFGVVSGFKVIPDGKRWCGRCIREGLKGGLD